MIIASYHYSITVTEPFSLCMFVLSIVVSTLPEWSYVQGDWELANCPVGQIGQSPIVSKEEKSFCWNTATLICLCLVYGCFCNKTIAEFNICGRHYLGHKP